MSQSRSTSQSVDRRQFVKGAIASTAALGMIPVGKACAITYDQYGNRQDWWCVIDFLGVFDGVEYYVVRNCRTGELDTMADVVGLDEGDCGNPENTSCVLATVISRWERVRNDGFEVVLSPNLSPQNRATIRRDIAKIAQRLRAV